MERTARAGFACRGVILDWLTITNTAVPAGEALEMVRFFFGEIIELEKYFLGYRHSGLVLGTGRVAWNGPDDRQDMGVCVSLGGRALGELSRQVDDLPGLLAALVAAGWRATRVDLALDDRAGWLDIDRIVADLDKGHAVTRWRNWGYKREMVNGVLQRKVTFGSRQSTCYARCYDKAAQEGVGGHWVRFEVELKGDRAVDAMGRLVLTGGGEWVAGFLRSYIRFVVPDDSDSNRRRWSEAAWWVGFLGDADVVHITLPVPQRTLETVEAWLETAVARSLALVGLAKGQGDDKRAAEYAAGLLWRGEAKLRRRDLALLTDRP